MLMFKTNLSMTFISVIYYSFFYIVRMSFSFIYNEGNPVIVLFGNKLSFSVKMRDTLSRYDRLYY